MAKKSNTHSDNVEKYTEIIKNDAPLDFLTEREKNSIHQECNIRSGLYCMLLSQKFADGMSNKLLFMKHCFKYAFDK